MLEKWQDLAATAPDALSSVVNLTANTPASANASTFFINGEFRVDQGSVDAAKAQLTNILRTEWLNQLPAPLNQTAIEIEALTAVEAATTVALEVPQPLFNQWKVKSNLSSSS